MTTIQDAPPQGTAAGHAPANCGPAGCGTPFTHVPLGPEDADALATTLKALAHPVRLRLLSIIQATEAHEACVCDLMEPVGLSQPTVSHHLKLLTDAGFLHRTKRGTWAYFSLVPGALDSVAATLATAGTLPTSGTTTDRKAT
ncbi:ArsR/SmtB family transcription factor [Brevibacterium litoralis]|uniref:ArsR/SmtB family transcription factor n=1 Tax=Brevibacterium litoralis TaxID=3138935 RepID=UPI0032ECA9EF